MMAKRKAQHFASIARMAREKAVDRNWEILTESVTMKDITVLEEWFKHNTSLHGRGSEFPKHLRDPVFVAVTDGSIAKVNLLLRHGFQANRLTHGKRRSSRPVHVAAKDGHLELLMTLLEDHGVPVDTEDSFHRTPLAYAVESNNRDVVQYLLSQGADCNRPDNFRSPFLSAVSGNKLSLVTLMIEHGANVNCRVREEGCLLNKCARLNYVDMMQLLYNNGARVNIRGKKGFGILHFALQQPVRVEVLKFLIKINAPLNVVCSEGRSVLLRMLCSKGKLFQLSRCIRLLVEAGYKVTRSECDAACNSHTDSCESLQSELLDYLSSTRPLQQLACFKVRHILGPDLPKRVHYLPLPAQVKDYIQLKHLTD